MASKEDLERGEKEPLLSSRSAQERSRARAATRLSRHGKMGKLERGHTSVWQQDIGIHEDYKKLREMPAGIMKQLTTNQLFSEHLGLSARAAFGCVVLAIPIFWEHIHPIMQHWIIHDTISWSTCVVFMLYTLGPTVGASVSVAYQGAFGVFLACANIIILYGIFPDAVTKHPEPFSSPAWYVAAVDFALGIFLVIYLNLPSDTKLFAAYEHCWFMMCFMNPHNTTKFSKGFAIGLDGQATKEMFTVLFAVHAAIFAAFFPIPVWSMRRATDNAFVMVDQINTLWNLALGYYAQGSESDASINRVQNEAEQMLVSIQKFDTMIDRMYWECFDIGKWGVIRKQLIELSTRLKEMHSCIMVAIAVAYKEGFEPIHVKIMDAIKDDMIDFRQTTRMALEFAVEVGLDGHMSDAEEKLLRQRADELRVASTKFSVTFSKARTEACKTAKIDRMSEDLLGEHAFALSLSNYGRVAQEHIDQVLEHKLQNRPKVPMMNNPFDGVASVSNWLYTFRNVGSIWLAFLIGFVGVPFRIGFLHDGGVADHVRLQLYPFTVYGSASLIPPFSAGIAINVSLLLSQFSGSAMVKNMGRLQGAVLGTILGQIVWVNFAWCNAWREQATLTLCYFFIMFGSIYIMHTSTTYGYIGGLLAVFAASAMLHRCSNEEGLGDSGYQTAYMRMLMVVMAILIMMLFDMVFSRKRASTLATETFFNATRNLRLTLQDFLSHDVKKCPKPMGWHSVALDTARLQAEEAEKEARHWRGPWRKAIFDQALTCHEHIRNSLIYMVLTLSSTGSWDADKSTLFQEILAVPECRAVTEHVLERFKLIFEVVAEVVEYEFPTQYEMSFFEDLEAKKKLSPEKVKALLQACERVAGPKSDQLLKGATPQTYLHSYPIVQCAMFMEMMMVISDQLAELEGVLVRYA